MLVRRGLQTESRIRFACFNQSGGFAMSVHNLVVAIDLFCWDFEFPQLRVKPQTSARTSIAIYKANVGFCNICNLFDSFGISLCKHESLCTVGKGDNFHVTVWE